MATVAVAVAGGGVVSLATDGILRFVLSERELSTAATLALPPVIATASSMRLLALPASQPPALVLLASQERAADKGGQKVTVHAVLLRVLGAALELVDDGHATLLPHAVSTLLGGIGW